MSRLVEVSEDGSQRVLRDLQLAVNGFDTVEARDAPSAGKRFFKIAPDLGPNEHPMAAVLRERAARGL